MFKPTEHLMQLRSREGSKDYLPVQWRLVWFREQCPQGTIETEWVLLDLDRETVEETTVWENGRPKKVMKSAKGFAICRAKVSDGKGGVATGTKSEKAASFPDFIEKAETGAIGRALAALGYGTQFAGEDFTEGERLADAPVTPAPTPAPTRIPAPVPPEVAHAPQPQQQADSLPLRAALDQMIARAKRRALGLRVAQSQQEWSDLLRLLKLEEGVRTVADVGRINEYLSRVERELAEAREAQGSRPDAEPGEGGQHE